MIRPYSHDLRECVLRARLPGEPARLVAMQFLGTTEPHECQNYIRNAAYGSM